METKRQEDIRKLMQMPEEDAVKEIAGIEDENILITLSLIHI